MILSNGLGRSECLYHEGKDKKLDWKIHHVNIPAYNVRQTAAFYTNIVGLPETEWKMPPAATRGNFKHDAENLSMIGEGYCGIHIIKPDVAFAKNNGLLHNATIGGHFAISVHDLEAVKRRLEAVGIVYSVGGQYAMDGVSNIYVYDPSMNMVEINQVMK